MTTATVVKTRIMRLVSFSIGVVGRLTSRDRASWFIWSLSGRHEDLTYALQFDGNPSSRAAGSVRKDRVNSERNQARAPHPPTCASADFPCRDRIKSGHRGKSRGPSEMRKVDLGDSSGSLLPPRDFVEPVVQKNDRQIIRAAGGHGGQAAKTHQQGTIAGNDDHFEIGLGQGEAQAQRHGTSHRGREIIEIERMLRELGPEPSGHLVGNDQLSVASNRREYGQGLFARHTPDSAASGHCIGSIFGAPVCHSFRRSLSLSLSLSCLAKPLRHAHAGSPTLDCGFIVRLPPRLLYPDGFSR